MSQESASCFWLLMQDAATARFFAALKAGNNMAARMAMMAITTNNSIKVKPARRMVISFTIF